VFLQRTVDEIDGRRPRVLRLREFLGVGLAATRGEQKEEDDEGSQI
jgi:hypothetical protein